MVNYKNQKRNVIIDKISKFFSVIGFCFCFLCNSKYDDDDENYRENELREPMAKIRLGFKGKDTWINSDGINIHQMFGKYSVLLDSDDQIVPLTKNGELFEPLDCRKSYKVVANHYGTTGDAKKWKELKKKEINDKKQFNLFKKQFKTTQQLKQKEQLDQYYMNSNIDGISNSSNNNSYSSNSSNYIESNNSNHNSSILDDNYHQVDIFLNDNINNSLINNDGIYINSNNNNNNNNNNQHNDNNYSFIEFVNNDINSDNNNNQNNHNIIDNITKDFKIDNKFYT